MLIPVATLEAIAAGRVDLAFRRWRRPTVKAGGSLRTAIGVLAIDEVVRLDSDDEVTDGDACRAGFADRGALLAALRSDGDLYRVTLHLAGEDPRLALRADADLDAAALAAVLARLDGFDRRSSAGAWTRATLRAIATWPGRRAPDLAAEAGRPTPAFKADVRKLKELGLTESLEVGYRLSPRGVAVLAALDGAG